MQKLESLALYEAIVGLTTLGNSSSYKLYMKGVVDIILEAVANFRGYF